MYKVYVTHTSIYLYHLQTTELFLGREICACSHVDKKKGNAKKMNCRGLFFIRLLHINMQRIFHKPEIASGLTFDIFPWEYKKTVHIRRVV